ncbi:MAG TPA: peptidoglycan glycosyltransferase, partial [Candidatus Cloacimonadota bacterium]|nr:peptidoglycan glycosyltransferase [Candidatus Cloacimonadota bacterium]
MKSRYRLLVLFLGGISLLWAVYLFWIQILDPYQLGSFRRRRYIPNREILIPKRGAILDANGELLVSSISYYQLDVDRASVNRWATRKDIPLQEAYTLIADQISENSDITHEQVMTKLNRNKKLSSIVVSNRIRESELEAIISAFEVQKLPGLIHSFSSMHRIYSKGKLAGRLLGAVAEKSNGFDEETASRSLYQLAGMTGIEATYDRILGGTYGWREIVLDANQERVP